CDLRHSGQWKQQRNRGSAERRRPELYPVLLQRYGWCGYWRTKLHAATLRNAVTNTYGDRYSYRNCDCNSHSYGYGNSYCNGYRNSYSHGNPYSYCDSCAQVDADTPAASDTTASPVGRLLRVLTLTPKAFVRQLSKAFASRRFTKLRCAAT